jgi:cysteine desulfurase
MTSRSDVVDLDSSATTPVSEGVLEAMLPYFREEYGNPSSPYPLGERAKRAVSDARDSVARLLSAESREILFTSGGTESNQTAVLSALCARPDRRRVVVSSIEHTSILGLLPFLEKEGVSVTLLPAKKDGRIDPEDVRRAVDDRTALVVVMWVNNETGSIQPVREIAKIAHEVGALFHSDGVAATGKVPVDLALVPADSFSLSGHKICGPKGTGALFLRKGTIFSPLMPGSQERKRRGGTENVPGVVGLGRAARESEDFLKSGADWAALLRDRLEGNLCARFPFVRRNGPKDPSFRAPHIANLSFPGIPGEKLQIELAKEGICVSMGSACSSGAIDPSHVLTAMGQSREDALSALRFSLGRQTTEKEIDRTIVALSEILVRQGIRRPS